MTHREARVLAALVVASPISLCLAALLFRRLIRTV